MKYWIGKNGTDKEGQYGTMDDKGYVPNSIGITKEEYNNHIDSIPIITKKETDIEKLIKWAKKEGHI